MGAWTTETTVVTPVENPPSPSVADLDTGSRMTLGGPIMRPVGVIEEDGGSPVSSACRYTYGCFSEAGSNAYLPPRSAPFGVP